MHWVYKGTVSVFLRCYSEGEVKVTYTRAPLNPILKTASSETSGNAALQVRNRRLGDCTV